MGVLLHACLYHVNEALVDFSLFKEYVISCYDQKHADETLHIYRQQEVQEQSVLWLTALITAFCSWSSSMLR